MLAGAIARRDQLTNISTVRWLLTGAEIVCVAGKARPTAELRIANSAAGKPSFAAIAHARRAAVRQSS
jgi:hypothetical protein